MEVKAALLLPSLLLVVGSRPGLRNHYRFPDLEVGSASYILSDVTVHSSLSHQAELTPANTIYLRGIECKGDFEQRLWAQTAGFKSWLCHFLVLVCWPSLGHLENRNNNGDSGLIH